MAKNIRSIGTRQQQDSVAQEKRVREGDFRMLCSDGRVIGSAKKDGIPQSRSIHVNLKGEQKPKGDSRKKAAAAKMRGERNRELRAELNREISTGKMPSGYHARLDAISLGSA